MVVLKLQNFTAYFSGEKTSPHGLLKKMLKMCEIRSECGEITKVHQFVSGVIT